MRTGFTLLELSIVLTLIAIIIGGGLVTLNGSLQAKEFNATVARMDAIEKALVDYSVAFNRIPCPSDLAITATGANYGIEAANTGSCTGGTPAATFLATSGTVEGGVPTRTLKLTDDYMFDGWGRKLRYAVDPAYTALSSLPISASCSLNTTPNTTAITVSAASGTRTSMAAYALISHGANGHGAYTSSGVALNAGSVNANELTNCHCTSSAAANATYTPSYIEMSPTIDSANALDNFDDIVTFKEAWQLQAQNAPVFPTACQFAYVADTGNNRVMKFDLNENYISQIGCASGSCSSSSANGQFEGAGDVAVDSSGNIWVTDESDNRVEKFDSGGNYLTQLGCSTGSCSSGTGTSQFNMPVNILIDTSGNIWVTDQGNYRVLKLDANGNYNGVTIGAQGTTAGLFEKPGGIAIDSSGNVYVPDQTNNNVQKFNSSGVYQSQVAGCTTPPCSAGSSTTTFTSPSSVAIDSTGNFWIADSGNNRVLELSSTGSALGQIGCTSGACAASTSAGKFKTPIDLSFDSSGNLWVIESQGNRVQEFTGTTYDAAFANAFNTPYGIGIGSR